MTNQVHRTDIQVRFADSDALGHINNASYATYAEMARLTFLSTLGESVQRMILANLVIDFRRQVLVTDEVHVDSWIERLGTSSMSIAHTILANGERAADITSVVVYFDYASSKAMPLTEAMRTGLASYVREKV
ncbi:MAG TPA: thioesterase family protein [Gemmatimonadaceae bacterium]|jgi:acyl-CoA thioester hydrolase